MMRRIGGVILRVACKKGNKNYSALSRAYSYQSEISLKSLYPNSKLSIYTPPPPEQSPGKFNGYIPIKELQITYSASSGPGGQHVNRVNTKVHVQFKVESASWLPEKTRQKLLQEHRNKINKDGCFIIKSDLTRSQQMNLADALNKLRNLIWELEREPAKPTEETLEKLRRRHERAAKERLILKRNRSDVKANRQSPTVDSF
ncbi:unnamed protein product [Hermetia illucens]|uniref:Large ribosomal subunit protein mL62 n=1 Tax=Hermetia illucens TaxID=343691 RepID=A0A7R8YPB4_HERIL|nr:peptidyl-tRNA hydrolase ICT1, mitochondrial [Hermetia illucens]CAD7080146.1 unnamed protein product [Hermetia illucens]